MTQGIFLVSGSDILSGASISTNSTGGSNGLGSATISGGQPVFQADDVVIFSVVGMTTDGQVGPGSAISDVTVFDSLADYQSWVISSDPSLVKYNYAPQNPGQTATVQSDISGLGDGYLKFNANVLIPQDGGPSFPSTLTVAPGTDIGYGGTPVTLDRVQDIDHNNDSDTDDAVETGDGLFYVRDYATPALAKHPPVCFLRGTRIATPQGERRVEQIRPGDLVLTLDHGPQPVRWAGMRAVAGTGRDAPIIFATGTLGNHSPLRLSPNHRVLVTSAQSELYWGEASCLAAAKFLVGRAGISRRSSGLVFYHHLMLDRHEILTANGALCESLLPDAARLHPLAERRLREKPQEQAAARRCLQRHEAALLAL